MKGRPEFITFTHMLQNKFSNENDEIFSNMNKFRENPQHKLAKNLACSQD